MKHRIIKRRIAVFLQIALLLLMCFPAVAMAEGTPAINMTLSKTLASVGDNIVVSGTTIPGAWVPLKVIDTAGNIAVFDATKADGDGSYAISFKVPEGVSGKLTVVAGEGSSVATGELNLGTQPPKETVARPTAWPAGGTVGPGTKVTLTTATSGANIYYTLDGSTPTSGSISYVGPVTINQPVTIKAIAAKPGMNDSSLLTASYAIAQAILETEVEVDGSNKELAITEDTKNLGAPVRVDVPNNVKGASVSVSALMNPPVSGTVTTSALPAINIVAQDNSVSTAAPIQVMIPAGTTISAPQDWNGAINIPTVQPTSSVTVDPDPGKKATVNSVIEIGYGDTPLLFNKAVRLVIPGQAGKDAGYYRNGVFTAIPALPPNAQDNQAWADSNIASGKDGKMDVGSDLVIWTKHFTKFVSYTQSDVSSPGSGGGGGGGISPDKPVTSTTGKAVVKPGAGGTVSLGSEASIGIPANALKGTEKVEVIVEKVADPEVPTGFRLVGSVYEFTVGGQSSYNFAKEVAITFSFDPDQLQPGETPAIYYYDNNDKRWVYLGGTISGNSITVKITHFTTFAVMAELDAVPAITDRDKITDIAGHWAENNIEQLITLGAVSGYPDSTFKPDNNITRAEFASILVKAFKLEAQKGKVFADTTDHWALDAISTAAYYGIVNGYDADTFGPNDVITREQMAVMIVKAANLPSAQSELSFADNSSISSWAKDVVVAAVNHGIISGYPDNTVRPQGNATRAEAATVIVKALHSI